MRCQVNLSNTMVERVDLYAKVMGVSRSALCSMLVGQGVMAYDKSMDVISFIAEKMGDSLLTEGVFNDLVNGEKEPDSEE